MAAHLEMVQWRVRPAGAVDAPVLGPVLPVNLDSFSVEEAAVVIRRLRNGKAPGPDGIPAEYLRALLSDSLLLQHATEWHLATVTGCVGSQKAHGGGC